MVWLIISLADKMIVMKRSSISIKIKKAKLYIGSICVNLLSIDGYGNI